MKTWGQYTLLYVYIYTYMYRDIYIYAYRILQPFLLRTCLSPLTVSLLPITYFSN